MQCLSFLFIACVVDNSLLFIFGFSVCVFLQLDQQDQDWDEKVSNYIMESLAPCDDDDEDMDAVQCVLWVRPASVCPRSLCPLLQVADTQPQSQASGIIPPPSSSSSSQASSSQRSRGGRRKHKGLQPWSVDQLQAYFHYVKGTFQPALTAFSSKASCVCFFFVLLLPSPFITHTYFTANRC